MAIEKNLAQLGLHNRPVRFPHNNDEIAISLEDRSRKKSDTLMAFCHVLN